MKSAQDAIALLRREVEMLGKAMRTLAKDVEAKGDFESKGYANSMAEHAENVLSDTAHINQG